MLKNRVFLTILEQFQKQKFKFFKFSKNKFPYFPVFSNKGMKISTNIISMKIFVLFQMFILQSYAFSRVSSWVWNKKESWFRKDFGHSSIEIPLYYSFAYNLLLTWLCLPFDYFKMYKQINQAFINALSEWQSENY